MSSEIRIATEIILRHWSRLFKVSAILLVILPPSRIIIIIINIGKSFGAGGRHL